MQLLPRIITALPLLFCATWAQADGLSDLKLALARLQGQAPLKASIDAKTWSRQGEGKDGDEVSGQASVQVEDGARGLSVLYGKDMLARLQQEERAKERDSKAKMPTQAALKELRAEELRPMLSAAAPLARSMEKAVFKGEKPDSYNGKSARLLQFDMPIDKLSEKDRKYVKSFQGSLEIWVAEDGTPLGSRSSQTVGGRAFVVVTFDAFNSEEMVYGLAGDRLVALRQESRNSSAGMGEKGENKVTRTLQLPP